MFAPIIDTWTTIVHEYSVALTIVGELDEDAVSTKLGLRATTFLKKGESMGPKRQRELSVWSFELGPSANTLAWQSLDDGLRHLAEKLLPLKSRLEELRQRYSTYAYCGHFGSGFGGGPSISPETLRMLAELGLTLTIKTYWSDESAEKAPRASPGPVAAKRK